MGQTQAKTTDILQKAKTLSFRDDSKLLALRIDQAFVCGHTLLTGKHYRQAFHVFETLAKARPKDQRVKVMLARCQAALDHYEACREILEDVLVEMDDSVVNELQTAFVYRKLGMIDAAVQELAKLVSQHADLPTACLFLGDMFAAEGRYDKAALCWKLAIKRDTRGGPVAKAAYKQLRQCEKEKKL